MNSLLIKHPTIFAVTATIMTFVVLTVSFVLMEPQVVLSQTNVEEFTVQAEITGEISFTASPSNVTLLPALPGATGGTASGTTGFTVLTNNALGYTVSIAFDNVTAMQYDLGAGSIPNAGTPAIPNFIQGSTTANTSSFGFTASGTPVISALSGTTGTCGSGTATLGSCFAMPADASDPYIFIDKTAPTDALGDSFELEFRVVVEQNPDPSLTTGTYTATATLTALEKLP